MSTPRSSGRLFRAPSPAMVVACIALAVALTGASYAAVALPAGSVGTPQLKNNAVSGAKVKPNTLTGSDIKEGTLKIPALGTAASVSGVDFKARSSTDTTVYVSGGAISRSGGSDYLVAPLRLPQGARITQVTFYVVDNDAATNLSLALTRFTPATRTTTDLRVVSTASLATSAAVQAIDVTPAAGPNLTVNNTQYTYNLLADPALSNANHQIVGARVTYSVPAPAAAAAARPAPGSAVTDG